MADAVQPSVSTSHGLAAGAPAHGHGPASAAAQVGGEHAHPSYVAHHFDDAEQQFDSAKFGMWLFLATEVLLFGGLFCAYAIWRSNHPELFIYGHHHLNKFWGAFNTVVLLASSFTMAWAVTSAQKGNRKNLQIGLALTLLGGAGFMAVKYVEYGEKIRHGLLWGKYYNPVHEGESHADPAAGHAAPHAGGTQASPDASHAPTDAQGGHPVSAEAGSATGQGHATDAGHGADTGQTSDPADAAGLSHAAAQAASGAPGPASAEVVATNNIPRGVSQAQLKGMNYEPTKIEAASAPPAGLVPPAPPPAGADPKAVRIFFSIYFCMTGLHGLHVLAGMAVITWLLVKATQGAYSAEYFTPVDLGGLYWHLVDLIWIFLFPLLYLIE